VAFLWQGKPMLGLVVGLALVINHTLASISGAGIPMLMKRLGFDPAQSATIFATTVTDIVGFFSLLGLAYLFMKYLI
jgi:magnesium transporter